MTTKGDLAGIGNICSNNALKFLDAALQAIQPDEVRSYIENGLRANQRVRRHRMKRHTSGPERIAPALLESAGLVAWEFL